MQLNLLYQVTLTCKHIVQLPNKFQPVKLSFRELYLLIHRWPCQVRFFCVKKHDLYTTFVFSCIRLDFTIRPFIPLTIVPFLMVFRNMQMWLNLLIHLYFTLKYHCYQYTCLITSMSVDLPFLCILACADQSVNHALLVVLTWEYVARHVLLCLFTWYCKQ